MKAVIYVRISPTKKRKETGKSYDVSIEHQLEKCKILIKINGDEVVEDYIDEYRSGKAIEYMMDFQRMLNDAKDGKFEKIYCLRVDRFGRSLLDCVNSVYMLLKLNISVQFVEQGFNTGDKFGRMLFGIFESIAEWQRESIRENMQRGRENENHKPWGRKEKEISLIAIQSMREKGMSMAKIAKELGCSPATIHSRLTPEKKVKDTGTNGTTGRLLEGGSNP